MKLFFDVFASRRSDECIEVLVDSFDDFWEFLIDLFSIIMFAQASLIVEIELIVIFLFGRKKFVFHFLSNQFFDVFNIFWAGLVGLQKAEIIGDEKVRFFPHSHFEGFESFEDLCGFSEFVVEFFEGESVIVEVVFFFAVFE